MQEAIVAAVKQRYAFDEWGPSIVAAERLFAYRYAMRGREVPGWTLVKLTQMREVPHAPGDDVRQAIEIRHGTPEMSRDAAAKPPQVVTIPRSRHATIAGVPFDAPPAHTRSFWQNPGLPRDVCVEAELHECASMRLAHEWLIHLLAAFESPVIHRLENPPFGDICFSGPAPTTFIYARGNMVINVRNATRSIVDVSEVARELDAALVAKPRTADAEGRTGEEADAVRRVAAGKRLHLDLPVGRPSATALESLEVTSKIFYTSGSVESDEENVFFATAQPGTYWISIYSIDSYDHTQYWLLPIEVSI
jgi:hypothetical protein